MAELDGHIKSSFSDLIRSEQPPKGPHLRPDPKFEKSKRSPEALVFLARIKAVKSARGFVWNKDLGMSQWSERP
jgi:hypothetical protein